MIAIVVEPSPEVREFFEKKLGARGYEVRAVRTAREALDLCIVVDASLLIVAQDLPDLSGFALVDRVLEGRKDLNINSIVLLEGEGALKAPPAAVSAPGRVLMKPVTEGSLSSILPREAVATESAS